MDVLLNGFWTDTLAPFLTRIAETVNHNEGSLWAVVAAVFLIAAAALISAVAAHNAQVRTLRLADRLLTEQRRQMSAIETLQHELWNLSDDLNRVRAARELGLPPDEMMNRDDADESKLLHITELLERLTEKERERRQQVSQIDDGQRLLSTELESLKARLDEQEKLAARHAEAGPGRAPADPNAAAGEDLARLNEDLAALAERFERMDALILRLARLRVE